MGGALESVILIILTGCHYFLITVITKRDGRGVGERYIDCHYFLITVITKRDGRGVGKRLTADAPNDGVAYGGRGRRIFFLICRRLQEVSLRPLF